MIAVALILVVMIAIATLCAMRLTRASTPPQPDVSPMKATLERRLRDGADFRL